MKVVWKRRRESRRVPGRPRPRPRRGGPRGERGCGAGGARARAAARRGGLEAVAAGRETVRGERRLFGAVCSCVRFERRVCVRFSLRERLARSGVGRFGVFFVVVAVVVGHFSSVGCGGFAPSSQGSAEPLGWGRWYLRRGGSGSVPRLRPPPACPPPALRLLSSAAASSRGWGGRCVRSPRPATRRAKLPNLHFPRSLQLQGKAPCCCKGRGVFERAGGAVGNFLHPREGEVAGTDAVLRG